MSVVEKAKRSGKDTPKRLTLADCPAYTKARDRYEFLRTQQAAAQAELVGRVDRQQQASFISSIDETARKLLALDPDAPIGLDNLPADEAETTREVEARLRVLDRAVELAQREHELQWKLASAAVIEVRRGEHVAIVHEIAEHLEALIDATRREQAWIDSLRSEGVYFTAGLGGTCNPRAKEFTPLFQALQRTDGQAFKRRLKTHGY